MESKLLLVATLSIASTIVFAETPVFNFLEAGYETDDIDDINEIYPSGFALNGSTLIDENVFVTDSTDAYASVIAT